MEFQQKKLGIEKTTQNIYRLFSTKTMKSKKQVNYKKTLNYYVPNYVPFQKVRLYVIN